MQLSPEWSARLLLTAALLHRNYLWRRDGYWARKAGKKADMEEVSKDWRNGEPLVNLVSPPGGFSAEFLNGLIQSDMCVWITYRDTCNWWIHVRRYLKEWLRSCGGVFSLVRFWIIQRPAFLERTHVVRRQTFRLRLTLRNDRAALGQTLKIPQSTDSFKITSFVAQSMCFESFVQICPVGL